MFCPHTQRYMVGVLPLTREWIEITHVRVEMSVDVFSLSRGSGLKSLDSDVSKLGAAVLPLTREWIEMSMRCAYPPSWRVLPLTREWIEIPKVAVIVVLSAVLPLTREWIEISSPYSLRSSLTFSLSRGSGLKYNLNLVHHIKQPRFSLSRGSGLKSPFEHAALQLSSVLPLTREWIEMPKMVYN